MCSSPVLLPRRVQLTEQVSSRPAGKAAERRKAFNLEELRRRSGASAQVGCALFLTRRGSRGLLFCFSLSGMKAPQVTSGHHRSPQGLGVFVRLNTNASAARLQLLADAPQACVPPADPNLTRSVTNPHILLPPLTCGSRQDIPAGGGARALCGSSRDLLANKNVSAKA